MIGDEAVSPLCTLQDTCDDAMGPPTFVCYIPSALPLFPRLPGLLRLLHRASAQIGTLYRITERSTDERSNRRGCFGPPMFGMMLASARATFDAFSPAFVRWSLNDIRASISWSSRRWPWMWRKLSFLFGQWAPPRSFRQQDWVYGCSTNFLLPWFRYVRGIEHLRCFLQRRWDQYHLHKLLSTPHLGVVV